MKKLQPIVDCDLNDVDISQYNCLKELHKLMAKKYGVTKNELEFFNSTESLIDSFFVNVVFSQKIEQCYIYQPSFKKYSQMANKFCKHLYHINRFDELDYPIAKNSLVIFTNPSKPDGKYYDLASLFAQWKQAQVTLFIDEAFLEYCNEPSICEFIHTYDKLYVLKSMQRFYNTHGLNAAILLSCKKNIDQIKKNEPKYKLSTLDTTYLTSILKDKNFKKISQAVNTKNVLLLEEVLRCSALFETIYSTNTNMLLCKLKDMEAKEFIKKFKIKQMDVKTCHNFKFLDKQHIRFTLNSEEDIKELIYSFQKILKG